MNLNSSLGDGQNISIYESICKLDTRRWSMRWGKSSVCIPSCISMGIVHPREANQRGEGGDWGGEGGGDHLTGGAHSLDRLLLVQPTEGRLSYAISSPMLCPQAMIYKCFTKSWCVSIVRKKNKPKS